LKGEVVQSIDIVQLRIQMNSNRAVLAREFERVGDKVKENLLKSVLVSVNLLKYLNLHI